MWRLPRWAGCRLITLVSLSLFGVVATEAGAQVGPVEGALIYKRTIRARVDRPDVAAIKQSFEERAIVAIKGMGGTVERYRSVMVRVGEVVWSPDDRRPPLLRVTLKGPLISDAELPTLRELENLQVLRLSGTRVTDAGIADLRRWFPRVHVDRR